MSGIFISYRREDSAGWTGRLAERLKQKFGTESIFMDLDTIEPGADFTDAITRAVGACDVLLAVIGPRWLTETDTNKKRRLDDPADWVRTEIVAALSRKIRVIPVLVGKANMPTARDLPPEIKALAERQTHELSDKRWDYDCQQLVNRLQNTLKTPARTQRGRFSNTAVRMSGLALMGIILVVIALLLWSNFPRSGSSSSQGTSSDQTADSGSGQYPIHLRANQEVRLKTSLDDCTYKILSAELERVNSSTLRLRLVIRLTVNSSVSLGVPFVNDSFRLLVDGVPRAPVGHLIQLVERSSAKEGTFEFTLPDTTTKMVRQVRDTGEVAEIPIDLTPVQL